VSSPGLISIVTPSFNQAAFLREAIESLLAQDDPHVEHIIVDGGSTDGTIELLRRYAHLRWLSQPDRGQADALNKGYAMAGGDIFGELNADDCLLPGCLQVVRREMEGPNPADAITGRFLVVQEGRPSHELGPVGGTFADVLRYPKGPIHHCSTFFRRWVFERTGGFDVALRHVPDVEMWLRMARIAPFRVVPEVLSTYRVHADSIGTRERRRNFSAVLYHLARHGPLDNFHEMYEHYVAMEQRDDRQEQVEELVGASLGELASRQAAAIWITLGASGRDRPMRVALFGAGRHTRWLLDFACDLPGPTVRFILDDRATPGQRLDGIPVIPPGVLCTDQVDAVVLSSDAYESQLAARCTELFSDRVRVIRLYEGLPAGGYDKPQRTTLHDVAAAMRMKISAGSALSCAGG
jgi:GT2 family glycosyltransferase